MVEELEFEEACLQVVSVNEARIAYYRMLASLFYKELTEEKIEELRVARLGAESADGNGEEGKDCVDEQVAGLRLMGTFLMRSGSEARQKLAADYARAFLGAGHYEERMAIPYESVYTSEDGLLMQDARDDVFRIFRRECLEVYTEVFEPEDHVSFEMEFMAAMASRMNEAVSACDWDEACRIGNASADFHSRHLANWIDDLCESVEKVAETKFYLGVAKLARSFVTVDGEMLADMNGLLERIRSAQRR